MFCKIVFVRFPLFVFILLISHLGYGQWNPDAGLVDSFTTDAIVEVSSGTNSSKIIDGDLMSFWESASPLPSNYIKIPSLNIFLNKNRFVQSNDVSNFSKILDGVESTYSKIEKQNFEVTFEKPEKLFLLSVKLNTVDTVFISIYYKNDTLQFTYLPSDSYGLKAINLSNNKILSIKLKSKKAFEVFEIAGLMAMPTEYIIFDFGKPLPIGWVSSRHYNGDGVASIEVLSSTNKIDWVVITTLNPFATAYINELISPEIIARYIKVKFVLKAIMYQKAKLLEFDVYDKYGPYGKPQPAHISSNTYSQSFGINAIWGWGYNVYSDKLLAAQGPMLYNKVAKLARNYHSIDWDIKKPTDNPDYSNMQLGNGTAATSWLNWDREYNSWKKAGFNIDACIMFNNQYFPDSLWHNTVKEAYEYGKYFALHFSKTTSLISVVEIGNEPWEYSKPIYRNILEGMSKGLKQNSKNLKVLPCAIQAFSANLVLDNYISNYLNVTNSNNIDGLNTHVYSYTFNKNGKRIAINPEDRRSEVWSINNLHRFSNANLHNIPIYVTEFGYDSDGGGDNCTHDVCVSEFEQAIYGVRMALILYRLGVSQFYWYYYANVDYHSIMHNRSGLTSSYSKKMQKKMSYGSFELLQELIGDFYFHHIIMENENAYIYAFSNSAGKVKRVIAWLPTSSKHSDSRWVSFPFSETVKSAISIVKSGNHTQQVSFVQTADELKINLSGVPVVIVVQD